MKVLSLALIVLVAAVALVQAMNAPRAVIVPAHSSDNFDPAWKLVGVPQLQSSFEFSILLKQNNLHELESVFWSVNDPDSEMYGEFVTKEFITNLVSPGKKVFELFREWLTEGGFNPEIAEGDDYINVRTTLHHARTLFRTNFAVYHHGRYNIYSIGNIEAVTIPEELAEFVSFTTGLHVRMSAEIAKKSPKFHASRSGLDSDELATMIDVDQDTNLPITPAVIREYYQVKNVSTADSKNVQAIAAFNDFFSLGALQEFDSYFHQNDPNITIFGKDCLKEQCDELESDLDIQYITSIGYGIPTIFFNQNKGWILEWGQAVNNMSNPPLIHSMSYGWVEPQQCLIDPKGCRLDDLNNAQYINRSDIELQKLGSRGLTVLVASGDAGAPEGGGGGGNCPMDPNIYCPVGGCQYQSTECPGILLTNGNNTCYFPFGIGSSPGCSAILHEKDERHLFKNWTKVNAEQNCDIKLDSDLEGNIQLYTNCSCDALTYVKDSEITFSEYTFSFANGAPFTPDYPTSSPYVISVGATQLLNTSNVPTGEIVSSISTGAIITGGGGFSNIEAMPAYQQTAVQAWISQYGNTIPTGYFNPSGRAYPDITLVGHNFLIFSSNNTNDANKCPCQGGFVDGTSASTPSSAGLLSLINEILLSTSSGAPLGFINPTLYKLAGQSAFNDIVSGNNSCTESYCCIYGYAAVPGWDPASGLGSINWPNLAQSVSALREQARLKRERKMKL
eukprot:TRINITY_DN842_c0_g2_i1.p1 TRINITY_DN842_c0_g2~~TRINITY_DN842_c0_g2_i1.p1  ORF type:complete len:732 (-),score=205.93 TRINITY_DN842_c0_g2_i1:92-2287(-)